MTNAVELALNYQFSDQGLCRLALTHRSYQPQHNERLEFLGDSVLGMVISEALYQHYPTAPEGEMTRMRSQLVRGVSLAKKAREFDLAKHIRLGGGELKSGGFNRDSILADTLEALLGAVYLDGGYAAVQRVILSLFTSELESLSKQPSKDPKTRLQELLHKRKIELPDYELLATTGEDHALVFSVRCSITALSLSFEASDSTRRGAEQRAARAAYNSLTSPTS